MESRRIVRLFYFLSFSTTWNQLSIYDRRICAALEGKLIGLIESARIDQIKNQIKSNLTTMNKTEAQERQERQERRKTRA